VARPAYSAQRQPAEAALLLLARGVAPIAVPFEQQAGARKVGHCLQAGHPAQGVSQCVAEIARESKSSAESVQREA